METHSHGINPAQESQSQANEFQSGSSVIYGLHGKCAVTAIEERIVANKPIRFYKLEIQRSALSRSTRQEPAIWVPVSHAAQKGLRAPLAASGIDAVTEILSSREYYFELNAPWSSTLPKLEAAIRSEGAIGLAKVVSYLFVLKRKQLVPSSEVVKFSETVNKLLFREIAEATGSQAKTLEEQAQRQMRHKLLPDH